tara:strand:- start:1394 stop:5008 length:3615 start_codon:yes stop_codon:yes gene_type:complete
MKLNNSKSPSPQYLVVNDFEILFDALFNQPFEFLAILSPEGRVLKINDLALTSQGVQRQDYIGKYFWKTPAWNALPEWENIWKQRLTDASNQLKAIITEDIYQVKDGPLHYADASTTALYDHSDELVGFMILAIDTTERHVKENQIKEHDARVNFVLEHSQIGHWELNLENLSSHRSLKHDQIFGYDSILPHWGIENFIGHVIDEDKDVVIQTVEQAIKNQEDLNFECRIKKKNGDIRWIIVSGGYVFDDNGQMKLLSGVVQDVTDIKKIELNKLHHHAELQSLFDALPDTYFRLESDGTILDYHTQNKGDLYLKPEYFMGKRVQDILPPEIGKLFLLKIEGLKQVNKMLDLKYQLIINKEVIHFEARLNKIPLTEQFICVVRNVTDEFNSKHALAVSENLFRTIFEQASIGVALISSDLKEVIRINQRFCDMLGYSAEEMSNIDFFQKITHPEDIPTTLKMRETVLCGYMDEATIVKRYLHKKGHIVWVEMTVSPTWEVGQEPLSFIVVVHDISIRKRAEEKLQLSSRVINDTREGIMITNAEQHIVDVNPAFSQITGYSREDVLGKHRQVLISDKQSSQFYKKMWQSINKNGYWQGELWNKTKQGSLYAELLTISSLKNDSDAVTHYVSVFSDITDNKRQQEQLNFMAHYDVLTKLPNRALFIDRFQQSIAHSHRTGHQLAVCFLDLDDFKPVNDKFGHDIGDRLLIEVSKRIIDCIREEDTVSRQGGDEFAILLNDIKSESQYEITLDRIHKAVAEPYYINEIEHHVTASIGVTLYPSDNEDIDTLIRHADHAMYLSKLAGKHRTQLYSLDSDQRIINKNHQLAEIKQALLNHEFELYYQPKINMATGHVFGVEALIRWNHPQKGLIPPLNFLPLTDGTSLEIKIGEWVIIEALRQLDDWKQRGIKLEISVNISSNHLLCPTFVEYLEHHLSGYPKNNSQYLQLEVLESSAFGDINRINQIVEICQNRLGVSFALDDFGTGYSSLTHLRRLPVNSIKIDQSFVRDMLDDPGDYTIIEGVITLTKLFNRHVIAEGVESQAHGLMLLMMGCEHAQGYEIAKPMPADDFVLWLKKYIPNQQWLLCSRRQGSKKETSLELFRMINEIWVEKFRVKLMSMPSENKPWPIIDGQLCQCGNWLRRESKEQLFTKEELQQLEGVHDNFHSIAYQIQGKYLQGNIDTARTLFPKLQCVVNEMHKIEDSYR